METVDLINLVSSILSLVLSVVAIWLSLYFYTQTKTTESSVSENLSAIKAQTDSLQKLTGRWMDRLTIHATDTSSYDSTLTQLIEVIKIIPSSTNNLPQLNYRIEEMTQEAVSAYIGMHHYCAIANVFAQLQLPNIEDYDTENEFHELVKTTLDNTAQNFQHLDGILSRVDKSLISSSPIGDWYQKTMDFWKSFIKDSTTVFQEKSIVE